MKQAMGTEEPRPLLHQLVVRFRYGAWSEFEPLLGLLQQVRWVHKVLLGLHRVQQRGIEKLLKSQYCRELHIGRSFPLSPAKSWWPLPGSAAHKL